MITQDAVLDIAREAIYTTIITSAPLFLARLEKFVYLCSAIPNIGSAKVFDILMMQMMMLYLQHVSR